MKTKRFVAMLVIGCLLLGLGMDSLPQARADQLSSYQGRWNFNNWMTLFYDQMKDKKLNEICLPSTHDSGTYNLRISAPYQISDKFPREVIPLLQAPGIKSIFQDIIKTTSIAQEQSIRLQLEEGIRRFDIRFKKCNEDGKLRIFHGMFGDTYEEIAAQIKDFMQSHPNEVLFIDLNISGEMWDFADADKKLLGQKFMNDFGSMMMGPEDGASFRDTTFGELIQSGKRLVVFCPDGTIRSAMSHVFDNNDMFPSYVGGTDAQATVNGMYTAYDRYNAQTSGPSRFEVGMAFSFTGGRLKEVFLNYLKDLNIKKLEDELANELSLQILNKRARGKFYEVFKNIGTNGTKPINIMTSDFYTKQFVEFAIMRNYGKNQQVRYDAFKKIKEAKEADPNNRTLAQIYDLLRSMRKDTLELEPEFMHPSETVMTMDFGGNGGSLFSTFHDKKINKIGIRTADRLDALTIGYEDGTIITKGGNGGHSFEINLQKDEYIIEITTSISHRDTIGYIEIKTNKGQVISGGIKKFNDRVFKVPKGWELAGFYGRSADEIDKLGYILKPHYKEPTPIMMSDTFGGEGGRLFSFGPNIPASEPRILYIRAQDRLDLLGIAYQDDTHLEAGGNGGRYSHLVLKDNEHLVKATFSSSKRNTIGYVKLETDQGHILEGGKSYGATIIYEAPKGYHIAGFYGRSQDEVDKVGCIYMPLQ